MREEQKIKKKPSRVQNDNPDEENQISQFQKVQTAASL